MEDDNDHAPRLFSSPEHKFLADRMFHPDAWIMAGTLDDALEAHLAPSGWPGTEEMLDYLFNLLEALAASPAPARDPRDAAYALMAVAKTRWAGCPRVGPRVEAWLRRQFLAPANPLLDPLAGVVLDLLFEDPSIAAAFEGWRRDPRLAPAWQSAADWAADRRTPGT